jgi:hypothetical protein
MRELWKGHWFMDIWNRGIITSIFGGIILFLMLHMPEKRYLANKKTAGF